MDFKLSKAEKLQLLYMVNNFVQSLKTDDDFKLNEDQQDSVELSLRSINDTFSLDHEDPEITKQYYAPYSLSQIFASFLTFSNPEKMKKMEKDRFLSGPVHTPVTISEEDEKLAEEKKVEGNLLVSEKKFQEAVEAYSEAIKFNPNSHIYYANRAAAYSHLKEHRKAIEDCKYSISISPSYSKAYSRLGLAYFSISEYEGSFRAYKKAYELEPTDVIQKSLAIAEKKFVELRNSPQFSAPPMGQHNHDHGNHSNHNHSHNNNNMDHGHNHGTPQPNHNHSHAPGTTCNHNHGSASGSALPPGLQNLPSLNELSSLMENPEVKNIIQNLQQTQGGNSQISISDLLSNPQIRQSAEALVSSGNQNISTLLQNPQLMQIASNFIQNPAMLSSMMQNFSQYYPKK